MGRYYDNVAKWIVLTAGLAYWTGFLIKCSFLGRYFALYPYATDSFRVEYVEIGCLFLLFPLSVCIPCICLLSLRTRDLRECKSKPFYEAREAEREWEIDSLGYLPNILLIMPIPILFNAYVLFAPTGYFHAHFISAAIVATAPYATLYLAGRLKRYRSLRIGSQLKTLVALGLILFNAIAFWRLWGMVIDVALRPSTLAYAVTIVLSSYLTVTVAQRGTTFAFIQDLVAIRTVHICMVGTLYFLSALAFASGVYPRISVVRGGGDFTRGATTVLAFRNDNAIPLPPNLLDRREDGLILSTPMTVIQETGADLFVVKADELGRAWGESDPHVPVYRLSRSAAVRITIVKKQELDWIPGRDFWKIVHDYLSQGSLRKWI